MMLEEPDYARDAEFSKLIVRQSDVDLTKVALEIARDAYPDLDMNTSLEWIGLRAEEIRPRISVRDELETLSALAECLANGYGLTGNPEAFEEPDSSYLNRVIETGRGIPISLSVIYMAVAEELDIPLEGVSAPMHFLTRLETSRGAVFLDAFNSGRVLSFSECVAWLQGIVEFSESQLIASLEPAGPRAIIIRMLNNLKVLYAKNEDWPSAWKVQHRLSTLQKSSYNERRDLGIISLHAGRYGLAVDILSACLPNCPPDESEVLRGHLAEAERRLSEWN